MAPSGGEGGSHEAQGAAVRDDSLVVVEHANLGQRDRPA